MIKIEKIYPEVKLDTKVSLDFIIKAEDEPEKLTWYKAMERFNNNPDSEWRLPTRFELLIMYENKDEIGGFDWCVGYWSSCEYGSGEAWQQRFTDGYQVSYDKSYTRLVRLVRKDK